MSARCAGLKSQPQRLMISTDPMRSAWAGRARIRAVAWSMTPRLAQTREGQRRRLFVYRLDMPSDPFHDRLLRIVESLPGAHEDRPWGSVHCKVAGKIFVGWGRDDDGATS